MNIKNLLPLPVAVIAVLLSAAAISSAQVLGSASNYALLGGTGAISIAAPGPNPIVNGNVGLSASATTNITGFPANGSVSGNTLTAGPAAIIATGPLTGQAGADLITARNALFALPISAPANLLSGQNLGTLAPLQPGVYLFGVAAQHTGALVLDANFQNGVAWVFNIGTSLTTSVNSSITFINLGTNGGSDNGLFWNAGAGITIGDNNTVVGNYMAGTSISFTGITNTLAGGGVRALAGASVSFAGPAPGGFNVTGGPGGGDFDGGLMYNGLGQLIPIPPPVPPGPPAPPAPVFSGNVILSSTGVYVPGTSGVILVPGVNYPTTTLTLDGNSANLSAPASLTINTATVTMTGTNNTYTGGTIVNAGALIATSANLPVNGAVTLNTSTLTFNQPASGTFGGVISGNGSVNKTGDGALTVTGASTYTGGTSVSAGTLVASTASLPANQTVSVSGTGVLVFNQPTNGTFGGSIISGGRVQKTGAGELTLTTTTTSPVDVQAGSFFFSTGLGATTVSPGATLRGTGTISGNLVNNGTVSPGASPGTINVNGNFSQGSTGLFLLEIASATSFDRLIMTGTASLAGTVQYAILDGFNPLGQSFTFLTAAGGVSGTFGTVNGTVVNSAATSVSVVYAPTTATLVFSQLPFAGFGRTPNQIRTAQAVQSSPVLTSAFNGIPAGSQFPAALNAVSPQDYQVWSDIAFAHSTALSDRLLQSGRLATGCDDTYFEGGQRRGRARFDDDLGSSAYVASTGLVGGNHTINANSTVGLFFGFDKTTGGLGSGGVSHTTIKNKTLGARTAWTRGAVWSEAMLAYGWDKYTSTRAIEFSSTAANSSTRGHQWTGGLTVGVDAVKNRTLAISPFAGLLASRWEAKSFTETDAGIYNSTLGRQRADSVRSSLGAEARLTLGRPVRDRTASIDANQFTRRSAGWIQPHVRATWLHEFYNDSRSMHASFADTGVYSLMTRSAPRNTTMYSAGVDLRFTPRALLYTDFTAQYGGGDIRVLNEWRVGLAVSF